MQPHVTPILWNGSELKLLDQRRLPLESEYVVCRSAAAVADAIRSMVVRGAPAIGVCAAFGVAIAARSSPATTADELHGEIAAATAILRATRPTAINLGWALDRMMSRFAQLARASESAGTIKEALREEAESIFREDVEANHRIGHIGSALLAARATVLTHCNAGALATAGYGTALGVIRSAVESGKSIRVFAGETRPYLQGARLTAWELQQDGIDVTLITDSMAGHFFQQRMFDAVIVGADRIAANGDTANKIGTYTLAVLANAHEIPFYVAAPISTIDLRCPDGSQIPIEERSIDEVTEMQGLDAAGTPHRIRLAPRDIQARHPAFDVTPARLVTAIITDRGLARAPYEESLVALVETSETFGVRKP